MIINLRKPMMKKYIFTFNGKEVEVIAANREAAMHKLENNIHNKKNWKRYEKN